MTDITLNHISKTYFGDPVFTDISLTLNHNERIALIGDNGTGKTTLFKIITGEESATSGEFHIRNGLTIGYLKQSERFHDGTVMEILEGAFDEALKIKKRSIKY